MSLYAIALKEAAAEPLAPAAFLSAVKGYTRDSARSFLRAQPGFLGRNLQLEAARELAAAAAQAGFDTMLIAETEVPAPPHPIESDWIEPKSNGFNARAAGALTFISYDSITVFSAAAFDAPAAADNISALKPGLFEKIARLAGIPVPPVPAPPRETFFRADIIGGEERLRLLLKPENLDFSPLGPARSHSSLVNFRALLDAISAPAFKAVKNRFLQAFISSQPLTALKVASPEAADAELARLLILTSTRAT
ncbi:MAG: hypothetical protein Q7R35_02010 [Elusimicrobiota bacterium]|nr:hypothetical protein [Elusimicrobiota bacterium]